MDAEGGECHERKRERERGREEYRAAVSVALFRKPYQSLSWLVAGGAQPSYRGLRFWTMRSLPASSRSPLTFVTGPNNATWSHENAVALNVR